MKYNNLTQALEIVMAGCFGTWLRGWVSLPSAPYDSRKRLKLPQRSQIFIELLPVESRGKKVKPVLRSRAKPTESENEEKKGLLQFRYIHGFLGVFHNASRVASYDKPAPQYDKRGVDLIGRFEVLGSVLCSPFQTSP
jgi:hypothetical protein